MGKQTFNLDQLAKAGRRWFAKPPDGFEVPSRPATSDISIYGAMGDPGPIGKYFENLFSKEELRNDTRTRLTYLYTIQSWLRQNGSTIFVDQEMLELCENTEALGCVEGKDLRTVLPVGYFSLPKSKGFVSKQTGDVLRHIWFSFIEQDGPVPVYVNGKINTVLHVPGRRLFMQGYWEKSSDVSSYCLPLDRAEPLRKTVDDTRKDFSFGMIERHSSVKNMLDEAYEFGNWMASLVLNLLLVMQSYPKYVETFSKERSYRQNYNDAPPPQSVLIRRSKSKNLSQVVIENEPEVSNPTGKTVGDHWRRGHWRRQPHGDQFELSNPEVAFIVLSDGRHAHMKWLLPVYIGLEKKNG